MLNFILSVRKPGEARNWISLDPACQSRIRANLRLIAIGTAPIMLRYRAEIESCLFRRGIPPGPADIAGGIAKPLDHDRSQILGLAGHAGAGTDGVAVLMPKMRRRLALLQRAGGLHHQLAEMQDAQIRGAEMFAGAVGDPALAVLHRGVLFGHALDAGVAFGFLQVAVD